jgi:hypothetical protein
MSRESHEIYTTEGAHGADLDGGPKVGCRPVISAAWLNKSKQSRYGDGPVTDMSMLRCTVATQIRRLDTHHRFLQAGPVVGSRNIATAHGKGDCTIYQRNEQPTRLLHQSMTTQDIHF